MFCVIAVNSRNKEIGRHLPVALKQMWGYRNAVTFVLLLELTCECPPTDSVRFPSRYTKFTVCQALSRNLALSWVSNFCSWITTENSSRSGCTSRVIELPPFFWENSSPPTHVRKLSPVCPWRDTGVNSRTYDEPLKKPSLSLSLKVLWVWRSKAREIRHTEAATEQHQHFNIFHSVQCACNYLHTPTYAHIIIGHTYSWALLHVSAINRYPQRDNYKAIHQWRTEGGGGFD